MVFRVVLALLFLVVSSGCGLRGAEQPSYGGTLTIRLKLDNPVINPFLDEPSTQRVARLIFSGLTKIDSTLRVQPDLAKSWEMSPSGLVWTFQLRENLVWQDGTPLTAEDVVNTYRYLMQGDPVSSAQADLQQVVEDIAVLDNNLIRFTLRRVFAPLLVDTAVPIVPKGVLSELGDPKRDAPSIGSGPFKLVEHKPGQAIILEANPSYYGGRPYLDRVVIMTSSENASVQAVGGGQLTLAELDFESLPKVPKEYGLRAFTELGYNYVGFNLREGRLFADKNLRKAWALALNKVNLVAESTGGRSQPIWSPIPLASWAYGIEASQGVTNPVEARKLLAESGWMDTDGDGIADKNGKRLAVDLYVRADAKDRVLAAQFMSKQLREVGFDVKVSPADFSTVMAAKRRPPYDFDAMVMGWNIGMDPDNYYLFASGQIPSAERPELLNYVGFKNPEYDRLAIEARTTLDSIRRKALYTKIQVLLSDELPYYFLWSERTYLAVSPRLRGPLDLDSPMFLWNAEKWYLAG